jgi:glyoxylase-like metal-dependent hydrolase (beta-lactamase superfamily II)
MSKRPAVAVALLAFLLTSAKAQDAKAQLEAVAKELGSSNLKSIRYSGTGHNFAVGQSVRPGVPWPKFILKSYSRAIDYDKVASREEMLRVQGENPPRGGGSQPIIGEQRSVFVVSGGHAWNLAGQNPVPAQATLGERLLQIWVTPHGFVRAALANNATVSVQTIRGRRQRVVSFQGHGRYKVNGIINAQNLVEKVETWIANPVLGDMLIETIYSGYKDTSGVKFPTRILQKHGAFPALDLTVTEVQPNASVDLPVPDAVRQAQQPVIRVQAESIGDGVWYLTGGTHHSVAVEFKDHIVVIEAPMNEDRSNAVIAEIKKTAPNKPIKYLINTHHHFDHSGGIRTFAAAGAVIITHTTNRPFYQQAFGAKRSLALDKLAQSKGTMKLEAVVAKRILTDGDRVLEIHHVKGNTHNEAMLMVYLPKEKMLIEADVYTPGAVGAPPPATPNPFSVNLHENIVRLKLDVIKIAPLHGRVVEVGELLKAIGKSTGS